MPSTKPAATRPWLIPLVSALSLAALVLALVLGADYGRRLERAQATVEAQRSLAELFSTVQDAQLGPRGYLLTGDATYLQPHMDARRALPAKLRAVEASISDNSRQRADYRRLDELSREVTVRFASTIEDFRRYGAREAVARSRAGPIRA